MIKKYWFKLCDDRTDRSPNEQVGSFEFVKTFDIKDSLIVWHDLREDPDDLPPLQCYVFISGGKNRHVAVLLPEGWHFLRNVPTFKIIEWAYIPKPPREEEDGNK